MILYLLSYGEYYKVFCFHWYPYCMSSWIHLGAVFLDSKVCQGTSIFIGTSKCNKLKNDRPWGKLFMVGLRATFRIGSLFSDFLHVLVQETQTFIFSAKFLFCPKWFQRGLLGPKSTFLDFYINLLIRFFWILARC